MPSDVKPPFRFADSTGKTYEYRLTFRKLREIQSATGVDVLSVLRGAADFGAALEGQQAAELCFAAVEDQQGQTLAQFEQQLDGDAFHNATDQLQRAVCFFFRGQQPALLAGFAGMQRAKLAAAAAVERKLAQQIATLGEESGNSPESPDSTQVNSNGGNL